MGRGTGQQAQAAFAGAIAGLLRESRRRQGLTQAQVAARTGGLVSKAALANYETGHRSLRVDIFWVIAKALGEDAGALLAGAERGSGYGSAAEGTAPITVDIASMQESTDERLAPVRRWFALRLQTGANRLPIRTVTLDHGALSALSSLMQMTPSECRRLLQSVSRGARSVATEGGGASIAHERPLPRSGSETSGPFGVTGPAGAADADALPELASSGTALPDSSIPTALPQPISPVGMPHLTPADDMTKPLASVGMVSVGMASAGMPSEMFGSIGIQPSSTPQTAVG